MKKILEIRDVSMNYSNEMVLENISLDIYENEFVTLLGPSGCGKTTLLNIIGGFVKQRSGEVKLYDKSISNVAPYEREVNTVFQNYSLFPHLNVFDNIAYSLTIKGASKDIIEKKVSRLLNSFGLEPHKNKNINQLSGGQKQRVTLARAIINEPEVLLLDEPLAALDFALREKMLLELMDLQEELGTTFIYVTHDQFEALTAADHIAIMNFNGEIEQIGTPKQIYEFPASSFIAQFVGTSNLFKGKIAHECTKFEVDDLGLFNLYIPQKKEWMVDGNRALMSIRPEKIWISKTPSDKFSNELRGIVEAIVYHGRSTQYKVRLQNGSLITVFEQNEEHFPHEVIDYDNQVYLYFQKENVVLLER